MQHRQKKQKFIIAFLLLMAGIGFFLILTSQPNRLNTITVANRVPDQVFPVTGLPATGDAGGQPRIATTKGISGLKILILTEDTLEAGLNNWFATQQGIVVDDFRIDEYGGGGYLVVVSYHGGGSGNSSTRFKLIAGENPEADAQAFLSSLGSTKLVRSIAATTRSYPKSETTVFAPMIFIVYENAAGPTSSQSPPTPVATPVINDIELATHTPQPEPSPSATLAPDTTITPEVIIEPDTSIMPEAIVPALPETGFLPQIRSNTQYFVLLIVILLVLLAACAVALIKCRHRKR